MSPSGAELGPCREGAQRPGVKPQAHHPTQRCTSLHYVDPCHHLSTQDQRWSLHCQATRGFRGSSGRCGSGSEGEKVEKEQRCWSSPRSSRFWRKRRYQALSQSPVPSTEVRLRDGIKKQQHFIPEIDYGVLFTMEHSEPSKSPHSPLAGSQPPASAVVRSRPHINQHETNQTFGITAPLPPSSDICSAHTSSRSLTNAFFFFSLSP